MHLVDLLSEIVQLSPRLNIVGFEKLELGINFQLADTINLHLYLDRRDRLESKAIIASRQYQPESDNKDRTLVFLPETKPQSDTPNLTVHQVPFTSGSHLIINQPSWWRTRKNISIGSQLLVCPLLTGETLLIKALNRDQEFTVVKDNENVLKVTFWASSREHVIRFTSSSNVTSISAKGSNWTFEKYSPTQLIKLDELALTQIIFSFDKRVVKETILIKRERNSEGNVLENEYYILALKV